VQIIKYSWDSRKPVISVMDDGKKRKIPLLGENISFDLGEKKCIGHFKKGKLVPCPNKKTINYGRHCNRCSMEDDFFLCMRCTGEECINEKQRNSCKENKYFIYIALFNSLSKVGISFDRRIMERLIEQGADFGAKIALIQDGKLVREIEQKISKELKIRDRVQGIQKHKNLFCNPNNSIKQLVSIISSLRSNGFSKYLIHPEIYDLREFYHLDNVHKEPEYKEVETGMRLEGNVVAAKGNIIILQKNNEFYTINAHRLIGREIRNA